MAYMLLPNLSYIEVRQEQIWEVENAVGIWTECAVIPEAAKSEVLACCDVYFLM